MDVKGTTLTKKKKINHKGHTYMMKIIETENRLVVFGAWGRWWEEEL